ncbi:unnamed protein product [Parnassius apollo]|uniref:(apollo) hypothetical protein n=1 Tax=Parnassius apollo TaxID=110799 RepID=A0A8S3Y482_PARAO|nr:unnamed protein product [Parnassius apollo]
MKGIGLVLTNIIKGNIHTKEVVEQLSDTAKIATEFFYEDSAARKYFVLSATTQVLKESVKNAKTEGYCLERTFLRTSEQHRLFGDI